MSTDTSLSRVLIVEDDRAMREALAKLLEANGFSVTTAASLADARCKLPGQAIVLVDLMLPDGDGEQFVGMVKRRRRPARVAVISATLDPYAARRWVHTPDASFAKPLEVDALLLWLGERAIPPVDVGIS